MIHNVSFRQSVLLVSSFAIHPFRAVWSDAARGRPIHPRGTSSTSAGTTVTAVTGIYRESALSDTHALHCCQRAEREREEEARFPTRSPLSQLFRDSPLFSPALPRPLSAFSRGQHFRHPKLFFYYYYYYCYYFLRGNGSSLRISQLRNAAAQNVRAQIQSKNRWGR